MFVLHFDRRYVPLTAQINQRQIDDQVRKAFRLVHSALVLLFLFAVGCAALNSSSGADIASTWIRARVYLPRIPSYVMPADVPDVRNLLIFVYLHGCTGISAGDTRWAR